MKHYVSLKFWSFVRVDISKMWHIASFLILLAILIGCGLQKPAPVLLKGEEFYGKRELEYAREYHLIREPLIKKKIEKPS